MCLFACLAACLLCVSRSRLIILYFIHSLFLNRKKKRNKQVVWSLHHSRFHLKRTFVFFCLVSVLLKTLRLLCNALSFITCQRLDQLSYRSNGLLEWNSPRREHILHVDRWIFGLVWIRRWIALVCNCSRASGSQHLKSWNIEKLVRLLN